MDSIARPVGHGLVGTELVRDWAPEGDPRATIVLVHGIAEHSGRYERTGSLLSDAGFHVRSFDLIGHGATGGHRVDIEDWDHFHTQLQDHMEWAREEGRPLVLFGHSMGGNLVLEYAMSKSPSPDLIVASAPALGGGAGWQRALAPIMARLAPTLATPLMLKGDQLSRDPDVGEAYFSDPLVATKASNRLGAALFQAMDNVRTRAHEITILTLVLHGGADTIVPPQSTAPLGELPAFERRVYPKLRHEILNEPEGPEVVQDIIDWIDEHL